MSEAIHTYKKALQTLEEAERSAEAAIRSVQVGITPLAENWKHLSFPGLHGVYFGRMVASLPHAPEWESSGEVIKKLNSYHAAMQQVQLAYKNIPADVRDVVSPPPQA